MSVRWRRSCDSGRVRWCVGDERQFRRSVQMLTLIPIALLLTVGAYALFGRYAFANGDGNVADLNGASASEAVRSDANGIARLLETEYVSSSKRYARGRRQIGDDATSTMLLRGAEVASFWERNDLDADAVRRMRAAAMRRSMDATADPCTDYYQYACGNWGDRADRAAGSDTFAALRANLDATLRRLLEEVDADEGAAEDRATRPIGGILKAKYLYRSCMNEDLIRYRGVDPLLDLLDRLGGWPLLRRRPDWNESRFDLIALLAELRVYNDDVLIAEWVGPDVRNSREYVIQLDQSTLGLPSRDHFVAPRNAKYLQAYRTYITTVGSLLGASTYDAAVDAAEIVDFEVALAKIVVPSDWRKNISDMYKRSHVAELHAHYPQIDWRRYLAIVAGRRVAETEPVVVYCWRYVRRLVELLARTPPRATANYVVWRFVRHRLVCMGDAFQRAKRAFYRVLFGGENEGDAKPPRWGKCVNFVNANLGMALGHMFVKRFFDEQSRNDTIAIAESLQRAFKAEILNTTWMDESTMRLSALKIDAMSLKIGYPDYLADADALTRRYRNVDIHPDYFLENSLNILKHVTGVEHARLGTRGRKEDDAWNTAPAAVNAYYSRNTNQITFPAGILQPPFYHKFFPKCLSYGGIGVVIGHEMTHGLDDRGRLFDRDGNLLDWWSHAASGEFQSRAQCIVDQYGEYVEPEINLRVDGDATQGENIADNGGLQQAFAAYRTWARANGDAIETLPGLNLTGDQLFFLNFAQMWCEALNPEASKRKIKNAVHSPGRFRVIGTLSNSREFAKAYECAEGSPMSPMRKCKIW